MGSAASRWGPGAPLLTRIPLSPTAAPRLAEKLAMAALVAAYGARAERLKHRVRAGGHHVPEDKIRKRQRRLWTLVAEAITACDIATVYDNSRLTGPRIVAQLSGGEIVGSGVLVGLDTTGACFALAQLTAGRSGGCRTDVTGPGWWRSLRTMTRMPGGHPDSSSTPVASATQADPGQGRGHRSDSSARPDRTNPCRRSLHLRTGQGPRTGDQGTRAASAGQRRHRSVRAGDRRSEPARPEGPTRRGRHRLAGVGADPGRAGSSRWTQDRHHRQCGFRSRRHLQVGESGCRHLVSPLW